MNTPSSELYTGGRYASLHPAWHAEDSAYKAGKVHELLTRNGVRPRSVCEVGCGAGGILRELHDRLPSDVTYSGWDIAPRAIELAAENATERLSFRLGDFLAESEDEHDLILAMDVVEHVENQLDFLRRLRAPRLVLYVPLDLNAENAARPGRLTQERREVGHLAYFNKDLALALLEDSGWTVRDWAYVPWVFDLADRYPRRTAVRRALQRVLMRLSEDFCVRLTNGFSLIVLAERG
jgi:SAM-dependent methyltransferase